MKIKKVDNLEEQVSTYKPDDDARPTGLFKRVGEKLVKGYIKPFGDNQNKFNEAVANELEDVSTSIARMNATVAQQQEYVHKCTEKLEMEMKLLATQADGLKTQVTKFQTMEKNSVYQIYQMVMQNKEFTEAFMRDVKPEARNNVMSKDLSELTLEGAELAEAIEELQDADIETVTDKLRDLEAVYTENAKNELARFKQEKDSNIIAVVCVGFSGAYGIEAIRNEAYDLYLLLKNKSKYKVNMVSVEPLINEVNREGDIIYVPAKQARDHISALSPRLCVICESTANILLTNNCNLLMFRSILKLSGQNPIRNIAVPTLSELCHLNDLGLHKYFVQSTQAQKTMMDAGFKEPPIMYPVVDYDKSLIRKFRRRYNKDKFTVGFASSPMTEEQMSHRGIDLLCGVVQKMPTTKFLILWRCENLNVPDILKKAKNCVIKYGKYDMERFYEEVDCMIIPFYTTAFNRACSMSAIEGMLSGLPTVCTSVSGVAEVVDYCGMGEVTEETADGLSRALELVHENYENYSDTSKVAMLKAFLDNQNVVRIIEEEAEKMPPQGIVTLYEWNRQLKQKGMELSMGDAKICSYYAAQNIDWFKYPHNCLDTMERKSVDLIISDYFSFDLDRRIAALCVSVGTGRELQELLKYGSCLVTDSSEEALKKVSEQHTDQAIKLTTMQIDYSEKPVAEQYDVITALRYIRHYNYADRKRLYIKLASNMKSDGLLIFDVPNIKMEMRIRSTTGWDRYPLYEMFWTKKGIMEELETNGFEVRYVIPVGAGVMSNMSQEFKNEPLSWTIAAVKKIKQ